MELLSETGFDIIGHILKVKTALQNTTGENENLFQLRNSLN